MNFISSGYPDLVVANRALSRGGLIILSGSFAGANLHCTGRKANGTTGYQVTVGKTLTILAMSILIETGNGSGQGVILGYADNDVSPAAATAFTNFVYMGGATGMSPMTSGIPTNMVPRQEYAIDFQVPASKYPSVISDGTAQGKFIMYGYEA